jgi:hypothetical protein
MWFVDPPTRPDENDQTFRINAPSAPTQRRPETGERIDGTPKPRPPGLCYLCGKHQASVYFSADVPKCAICHDRFRRKSE